LKAAGFRAARGPGTDSIDPPIRAELFSLERLEQHAQSLALSQPIDKGRLRGLPLDRRLRENTAVLAETYRFIAQAFRDNHPITPAAEWLLDNFHVVEEQVREIKHDLPPGFYRRLPKLAEGPLQGFPRVIGIAWAFVAHTDSVFDLEKLTAFVAAYQRVEPLSIGELWALAISLRITLVENLRRLAQTVTTRMSAGGVADDLADRILGTAEKEPDPTASLSETLDRAPWSMAFAVQLVMRLRDCDPKTTPAATWLDAKLSASGTSKDELVREEVQRQAATNVTVRNIITSMRQVSMVNWAAFVESISPVDAILRAGSVFATMDFSTRDMYRRAIEDLARQSGRHETDVANRALEAAKRASAREGADHREGDPGYYLIAQGRPDFERELNCRVPLSTRVLRLNSRLGVMSYVGLIATVTALVLALAILAVARTGASGWTLLVFAFVGLVPASDVAISVVNRIVTQRLGAMRLPAFEFPHGPPPDCRTIVVVPTLLSSVAAVQAQVERLEVHHLSCPGDDFIFALLSDWRDADTEVDPGDEALLRTAVAGISRLNARYGAFADSPRFIVLHRRRVWNPGAGKWICWERKRGKLHELNQLLRGAQDTSFLPIDGQAPSLPANIRYVITLDSDTRLPIGAARRLVGKMAHPLNRPRFDPVSGLVVQGHGILQPRVTPSLPVGSQGSLFERVFSGPNGLDPYALAVSDIYQDLFEEGSYCGKGIYDVDIFSAALAGQIPDDTVLSHDLLEGIFARAGLASDIEVVEEFPSRYDVAAARQHRWTRGDWQLLPWIFGCVPKGPEGVRRTTIPIMGRWKLMDNLRRSLSAPAALLALLIAWAQPAATAEAWTAFIIFTVAMPPFLPAVTGFVPRADGVSIRNHLRSVRSDIALGLVQSAFLITFLAHQAWLMVDAVFRTLFRLLTRRRLLEWVSAAQAEQEFGLSTRQLCGQVAASAAFAALVAAALYASGQARWALAAPFAAMWVCSPLIAWWASLPPAAAGRVRTGPADAQALRLIGRRTWRFFETFVGQDDHALPPDNFQEDPDPVIAHRTSPTNIGLYLLSVVAARDFGWIGTRTALERLEATVETLERLERFRGHFYNWYDTQDLRPLEPRYISSVDSGNLAGHLIALANACREMAVNPVDARAWRTGLQDHLDLIREAANGSTRLAPGAARSAPLSSAFATLRARLAKGSTTPAEDRQILIEVIVLADTLRVKPGAGPQAHSATAASEVTLWAEALRACAADHRRDWEDKDVLDAASVEAPASTEAVGRLEARLGALADRAMALFNAMEFGFLFDEDRQLLSIGYRNQDGALDGSYYDLLASEARLASFIAIAKGDLPAKHWFRLGRTMTPIDGGSGLISWSGSMFEYLMPSLVMRAPAGSLLEQTNRLVVWRQMKFGEQLNIPWGVSESEYNARDLEKTYQYSSFGIPDLGYKRGLADSVVIAPYASGLAAMVQPKAALQNYRKLAAMGGQGAYGWYEAVDFTRSRLPEGAKFAVVKAYMAHHQAMTLVGLANTLQDGRMRARFHAEPIIQAAELLLQERMPRDVALARPPSEQAEVIEVASQLPATQRRFTSAHSQTPRTHILSNGRYSTLITAAGAGYSRWRDVAVTRWREDVTSETWGSYVFLRDAGSRQIWSAGYQPTAFEPDRYEARFSEGRAEIIRDDGDLTTALDVLVSSEDEAEVRRVSLTNHGLRARTIDVTSYAELSLARQADDVAHPAFAKLFVETAFEPKLGALLATRRQRSTADPLIWAAHLAVVEGDWSEDVQFETDRARFLGRGGVIRAATAVADGWPLSNSVGPILDPIFSLRRRVTIAPGATARIAFWTVVAPSREAVLAMADKHRDPTAFDRAVDLAWTQAQMQLRHLGATPDEAHLFQRLAGHVLYSDPSLRPDGEILKAGLAKVSTLWARGISGDRPLIVAQVDSETHLDLIRQLLRAQQYWQLKQLAVDLVILNDRAASYIQDLQVSLESLVRIHQAAATPDGTPALGGVFVLRADLIPGEVRGLLLAAARAVLRGDKGTLAEQLNRARDPTPARTFPPARLSPPPKPEIALPPPPREFANGLGGFVNDGRDYLTILSGADRTPAPWVNVIANPGFGFQVSADGAGFTWSENSQQNQLTPWSNDPVGDRPGEVIYVTDEDTGEVWGPTSLPIRDPSAAYSVRHGKGYSLFEHASHGVALELLQFVPVDDPIKIMKLTLTERSGRARRLSVTAYVEWVLGAARTATAPYVVTEMDPLTGAMFARNPWNDDFGARVAFVDLGGAQTGWTGDRKEFLGRHGALARPLGLTRGTRLSGRTGAGLDPCGALQTQITLKAFGAHEVVVFLGQTAGAAEASALIEKYRQADLTAVMAEVTRQWDEVLGALQIKTPDRALDILVNSWLPYQTLACRVWARTGFYQASGAYGFRDQLQDGMALCLSRPDVTRAHLLRAAGRQFREGDVQHWWLPETGRGIRTRVSDDRGWLAYAVAHYVEVTGDFGVLDEPVPFLEGKVLGPEDHDAFFQPTVSENSASLFDHCALALETSLGLGVHGLPLMGAGDWNDGMDQVGAGGRGESVWLGWFLYSTLERFSALAAQRGRQDLAQAWRGHAAGLQAALEAQAWDGDWYRRAFFDDGEPLGSVANTQCRIDSIAQSWAVISGAAAPDRAGRAMEALDKFLLKRDERLSLLFTPPFNQPSEDPGYIKGYPPGLRENGGQYTHAATWAAMAFAVQGDGDRAGELLAMINPIRHADSPSKMRHYKVEPYVACADVYSEPPHVGRGGWTWYTGSAAWLYRVALESVLGFQRQGDSLVINPCIPRAWPGFDIAYRHGSSRYKIVVENPLGVCRGILSLKFDGKVLSVSPVARAPLLDDGQDHIVEIVLG
jgi:cyclic beta-1,2-glucan synthetase